MVSVNSVSMYERELSTQADDVKVKIAQLFHVSLDYLMGNATGDALNALPQYTEMLLMKAVPPTGQEGYSGVYRLFEEEVPDRLRSLFYDVGVEGAFRFTVVLNRCLGGCGFMAAVSLLLYGFPKNRTIFRSLPLQCSFHMIQ